MTRDQVKALLGVVDAKIQHYAARDSSDGGLYESIRESELEKELLEMFPEDDEAPPTCALKTWKITTQEPPSAFRTRPEVVRMVSSQLSPRTLRYLHIYAGQQVSGATEVEAAEV